MITIKSVEQNVNNFCKISVKPIELQKVNGLNSMK